MRIVFAGTPETAVPTLEALLTSSHEVLAVVTRPDAPTGRGRKSRPSAVAEFARERGLEVLTPEHADDPEFMERMAELAPDLGVVVAYGALLRRELLDVPEFGWVNLHFSVLPAWRGAAPVQRSIMAGDEITGATVFSLVEELDAGPVLATMTERIRDEDTSGTLLERLAGLGADVVVDVADHIEAGKITGATQDEELVTIAHKLTTEDGRVDWTRPAFAIDRQIRGCTPAPGAWTTWDDTRVKLGPVRILEESELEPGVVRIEKKRLVVGTGTNDVLLGEVQPHGKRMMAAADWGRGLGGAKELEFR